MSNRIFITGATGNIGTVLSKELKTAKADFYEGVTSANAAEADPRRLQIDFSDREQMVSAFQGIDTLFLLFPMVESMIDFAKNAVSAAQEAGVGHIVRSSGAGANSTLDFTMPKVQGTIDDLIVSSGIPYTLTKPASFMQNFVQFYGSDIQNGTLYSSSGQGKLGWVDVRDIAAVNAKVLLNPADFANQELTITGPQDLSFQEALALIAEVTDRPLEYKEVTAEMAIQAMREKGTPEFIIAMSSSLNQIIKAGFAAGTTDTVEKLTGKQAIPFEQFARDYKNAWI